MFGTGRGGREVDLSGKQVEITQGSLILLCGASVLVLGRESPFAAPAG